MDWSSDVCSSDLAAAIDQPDAVLGQHAPEELRLGSIDLAFAEAGAAIDTNGTDRRHGTLGPGWGWLGFRKGGMGSRFPDTIPAEKPRCYPWVTFGLTFS